MYKTARLISCLALAVTSTAIHSASLSAQPAASSPGAASSALPEAPRNVGYSQPANFDQLPVSVFNESRGSESDSQRITDLIDEVSRQRTRVAPGVFVDGGVIRVTNGEYRMRNIALKSNVHLRFDPDVTIFFDPEFRPRFGGSDLFTLSGGISNVSIVGDSRENRAMIIGPPKPANQLLQERFRAVSLRGVRNFLVSNLDIDNTQTRFVTIFLGGEGANAAEAVEGPRPVGGEISNIAVRNAAGGFGSIQAHTASRVRFSNIFGEGGVTLRLETGIATAKGLTDIDASNIRVLRGRTGVLFQPHAVRSHNRIRVRNVRATESGFAVEAIEGFVSSRDLALNDPRFTRPGRFRNVLIENLTARFGRQAGAQIRPRTFRLIPGAALDFVPDLEGFQDRYRQDGDTLLTRPLGVMLNEALSYDPVINRSSVDTSNLPSNLRRPRIVTRNTPDRNSDSRAAEAQVRDLLRETREDAREAGQR